MNEKIGIRSRRAKLLRELERLEAALASMLDDVRDIIASIEEEQ